MKAGAKKLLLLYGRVEKPHFCRSRLRGKLCRHISKKGRSAEGWDLTAQPELLGSSLCLQGTICVQQPKQAVTPTHSCHSCPFFPVQAQTQELGYPQGAGKAKVKFLIIYWNVFHELVCQGVVCPGKPGELSGIKSVGIFLLLSLFFSLLKTSP